MDDIKRTFLGTYLPCVAGIVISIVLPILRGLLPKPLGVADDKGTTLSAFAKPYLVVGLFSLITALLVVSFLGDTLNGWRAALLAGYAWDSTLQKISKP